MSSKKTIKVNKDFYALNNQKKKKSSSTPLVKHSTPSSNKIRKDFLKKIKEFQQKRIDTSKKTDSVDNNDEKDFENEFNKSLRFLQNVSASNKKQELSPKTIPYESIHLDISDFDKPSVDFDKPIVPKKINLPPKPPYSTLKGTSKPTYREWIKTQKSFNGTHAPPTIMISDKPKAEETIRSKKLELYKKENVKKPIMTIKRTLGKNGKSVSVLIKSRKVRDNIQHEKNKLKQTTINEIKNYLRSRNMIKIGSKCPNDILRKMYEQCILAGIIQNKSKENLIHNYVNDKH